MHDNLNSIIDKNKIFAVIRTNDQNSALKTSYALIEGGIQLIEISLLTKNAFSVIKQIRDEGFIVGAGTVMNEDMALKAIDAGSQFIISPIINEHVIKTAISNNIMVSAGCITPNEIHRGYSLGVDIIKIFPAHQIGGCDYIKALMDVFPNIPFMPTGGININNISNYIRLGVKAVGMSTSLIPNYYLENNDYQSITNNAKEIISFINQSNN